MGNVTVKASALLLEHKTKSKTYLLTQWLVGSVISIILFFILDGKFEILTAGEFSKLFGLAFIDIFNYSLFLYTIKRLSATFTTLYYF